MGPFLHLEGAEFSVAGVNPMLHVALHAVLENQLAEKQPPEAGTTLNRLMSRGFTRHEASHLILEKLIEEMAPVLREHRPFDVESYRRKLLALGAKTLGSKVSRNEPCPCGSGRKFKRCCGRDGTGFTSRPAGGVKPGRMLLATQRVAFHHAGLSSEARYFVERLVEEKEVFILCAATTLAQGVHFPLSVGLIESFRRRYYKNKRFYWENISPFEFWNIVGRVGRTLEEPLGLIAFPAAKNNRNISNWIF